MVCGQGWRTTSVPGANPIHHLGATYFPNERWDPEHTAAAVDRQINGGDMDGFAASYAETLAARGVV